MFQGLKYVYAVYECGSVSEAAKKLYISQPSLSASIKREEELVGMPIFDRSTKPLTLTECGRAYIKAAEQIMLTEREFTTYLEEYGALEAGKLTLGGTNMYASFVLPAAMQAFAQKYPNIKLELIEENSDELMERLMSGRLDMIMDNSVRDESLVEKSFYYDECLLLAVPKSYPANEILKRFQVPFDSILNDKVLNGNVPPVPLREFRDAPYILLKSNYDTRRRADKMFASNKITPRVLFELDQQSTAYNIASSGMGVTFVSNTLVKNVTNSDNEVFYTLPIKESHRAINFYWKRGRYVSKAMKEFISTSTSIH